MPKKETVPEGAKTESPLPGTLGLFALLGLYFAAQLWILPAMGVAT
ncbi:hypothetical protein [Roseibacillus ishigakijimensis]|uniref:Uncharacterized protein n=1 Tax=Roseibacillus ishigakijimensis TaxID=454146 RepID=A0A934VN55_9BACT|nr:hypothetical protein [Roseibacillus ishigakijimensis]MBK1834766.1 hypothetical protein [Roseibacillus ishigakijimensis]